MKNKLIGIALVAVVVIATSVGLSVHLSNGKVVERVVGAIPTLDGVDDPYVSIGGRAYRSLRVEMAATSSVLCSANPGSLGTSTLESFSFSVASSSINATQPVTLSTSTSAFGSSTVALLHVSLPANGTGFNAAFQPNTATTTLGSAGGLGDSLLLPGLTASGTTNYIVNPTESVNLRIGTTTAGVFTKYPQGYCNFLFRKN